MRPAWSLRTEQASHARRAAQSSLTPFCGPELRPTEPSLIRPTPS